MHNSSNVLDLKARGFVPLAYPIDLKYAVRAVMQDWEDFCGLPESTKEHVGYLPICNVGVGYELKKTKGTLLDQKEDFHFTPAARDHLYKLAEAMDCRQFCDLVCSVDRLTDLLRQPVFEFALKMEKAFGLPRFADDVDQLCQSGWPIRLLHYFGGAEAGEEIAKAHADKSSFTLHLHESDPGLQYLDHDKAWHDMPVSDIETVIIPGMRLQYRSQCAVDATVHRVVATPDTAANGRFSAVCFIHSANTPWYDKEGQGRLQEKAPGFNYGMPFEEFRQFFTE